MDTNTFSIPDAISYNVTVTNTDSQRVPLVYAEPHCLRVSHAYVDRDPDSQPNEGAARKFLPPLD
jgi:hypothetical protein